MSTSSFWRSWRSSSKKDGKKEKEDDDDKKKGKKAVVKDQVEEEVEAVEEDTEEQEEAAPRRDTNGFCNLCTKEKRWPSPQAVYAHQKAVHKGSYLTCAYCPRRFPNAAEKSMHQYIEHGIR